MSLDWDGLFGMRLDHLLETLTRQVEMQAEKSGAKFRVDMRT